MNRLLVLLTILMLSASPASAGTSTPEELKDLYFGEALYYAFQGEWFDAIARLDTELMQHYGVDEPELDTLHYHINQAEFDVGDFELSYRMHQRAGRAITAVIEGSVEEPVRNEAIFRLARIYFQKDQPVNAQYAVDRIKGTVPDNIQDDLDFLREKYARGAANHMYVLGIHTFGFGRPPEMPPDGSVCPRETLGRSAYVRVEGPELVRGCYPVEGLVFRRAEQMRAIMVEYGDENKPVWATEFGWLIRPPPCCLAHSDWYAQAWHATTEGRQARYLIRAYRYAGEHWPWMQAMFLWNLDWSRYEPGDEACPNCDTMGAYSILNPDGSPRTAYKWFMGQDVRH